MAATMPASVSAGSGIWSATASSLARAVTAALPD